MSQRACSRVHLNQLGNFPSFPFCYQTTTTAVTEISKMNTELQQQLTSLVTALEEATVLAKQLPSTTTANIYASLRTAHRHLSLFLTQQTDNNIQHHDDDEPMQIADEVETVEERMKDCSIQTNNNNNNNKRLKRSLSPTSLAGGERMRWMDYDSESFNYESSNSNVNRLRALDLIYQFHS
ncbi:uncharacterized protein LOC143563617 [Bidens hawaiensis]|uniref:uncharacterized protein LOC143563617 n=1 Tax=Bidens hawaiensis TaxID=980011 RepID=UPI00404B6813